LAQALHPEKLGDRAGGSRSAAGRSRLLAAPSGRAATRAAQPPPRLAIRDDGAGRGRMAGPEEEEKEVEATVVDTRTHFAHSRVSGNPVLDWRPEHFALGPRFRGDERSKVVGRHDR